jgi:hypothetical protein
MINSTKLPNTMYFGASKQMSELKGEVFLTPHPGIASLFVVDVDDLFPKGYAVRCNLSYAQWFYANDLLTKPLKEINVLHNVPEFEGMVFTGQSSGYIHKIDISKIKDKLSLFETEDADREVVYHGDEPLEILEYIPCTICWDFTFSAEEIKKHGLGSAVKVD